MEQSKSKLVQIADACFWIGILCELVVSFSGYLYGDYGEKYIIVAGMVFFAVKILLTMNIKKEWWIYILCAAYGLICYKYQHSALILRIFLILLAGKDKNFRTVCKVFFWGTFAGMFGGMILAAAGVHNSIKMTALFRHVPETRYRFGFYHPNGFALFSFRLFILGLLGYEENLNTMGMLLYMVIANVFQFMAGSKMGVGTTLFISVLYVYKSVGKDKSKILAIIAYVVIALEGLLVIASIYSDKILSSSIGSAYQWINGEITTGRLVRGSRIFKAVNPTLLGVGQKYETSEIGYINAMYSEGILFIALYIIFTIAIIRMMQMKKDQTALIAIIAVLCYSMAESFLPYVNKNAILMLAIGLTHKKSQNNEIEKVH